MADFDVIIAGGGLVGLALVAALKPQLEQGLKLGLVETTSSPKSSTGVPSPSFDDRSTALNRKTVDMFQHWQIWPLLQEYCCPITQIQVSDQGGLQTCQLTAADMSESSFGYVAPNRHLGHALNQVTQTAPVTYFYEDAIQHLTFQADQVQLTLKKKDLTCKLLVLADGGRSELKTQLGIQENIFDFGHHAFISNIQTSEANNNQAFERFTDHGPMAMLPLSHDTSALVWSVANARVDQINSLSDEEFLFEAQKQFGGRLGQWQKTSKRSSYPLIRKLSMEMVRSRLVLLGNTAASLHPVAGQGLNLAARCIAQLQNNLFKTPLGKIGELKHLLEYQRQVEKDIYWTVRLCDELVSGFEYRSSTAKLARALGIATLDQHSSFKSIFSQYAMGIGRGQ